MAALFEFVDDLAGDLIATELWDSGYDQYPEPTINDDESFNKKALARLVYLMKPVIERASMKTDVVARDLLEMSKTNGADAQLLTAPKRNQSFRNNRDIKAMAMRRVCEIVYHESSRTRETITSTRQRLNQTDTNKANVVQAEERAWDKMRKEFGTEKREAWKLRGKLATAPHPNTAKFDKIWQTATTP